jgi:cation:H+ antiporter
MFSFLPQINLIFVILIFIASLFLLSKATDILVDNAVTLSMLWGLSDIIIGATVISLGTTLPELSSSVIATLQGKAGVALGNAVGSLITNTSLVLGLGAFFGRIPVRTESSGK